MKILFVLLFVALSLQETQTNTPNPSESQQANKVKLAQVKELEFFGGKETAARRYPPRQQILVVGPEIPPHMEYAKCFNKGVKDGAFLWECQMGKMDKNFKIAKFDLKCEGYDKDDDEFMLVGSCSLIVLVEKIGGERTKDIKQLADYTKILLRIYEQRNVENKQIEEAVQNVRELLNELRGETTSFSVYLWNAFFCFLEFIGLAFKVLFWLVTIPMVLAMVFVCISFAKSMLKTIQIQITDPKLK